MLNKLYVLMENAEGLVLVDQHAAHERILFEELRRRMEEQGVPSQRLLLPQVIELPPRDAEWIERNLATLQKMGIGIEPFAAQTFKIDSLPTFFRAPDPSRFMQDVIDELKSASNSSSPLRLGEDMIAKTVCRHAVKANDPLHYPGSGKTDSRSARMRAALLLPARPADHDPDFARRTGEEIRTQGLTRRYEWIQSTSRALESAFSIKNAPADFLFEEAVQQGRARLRRGHRRAWRERGAKRSRAETHSERCASLLFRMGCRWFGWVGCRVSVPFVEFMDRT